MTILLSIERALQGRHWPRFYVGGWGLFLALVALGPGTLNAETIAATSSEAPIEFVGQWLDRHKEGVVQLYEQLHAQPELSLKEKKTSEMMADALRRVGYEVTEGIGGYGVVAVLRNGEGPTLLVRADMDALPVIEETGLPYASEVKVEGPDGVSVGVMHACGHDIHMTALLSMARIMAVAQSLWRGTLVLIAQPAEEVGAGARAMMAAGLFRRFPRPDYTLALHVESSLPAGSLGYSSGWAMANVDSVDITFFGRGGHGARPNAAIDPIVMASSFVLSLQTLVSRRIAPQDPAVVTVGSFHSGTKHNVIPDEARLQLTVRSYSDEVRDQLLSGIAQLARDTSQTFESPQSPEISIRDEYTPAVYNDPILTERAVGVFRGVFGEEKVVARAPSMGGEDFGRYGRELGVPSLLYRVGAQDPEKFEASLEPGAEPLPSLHSSRFAPLPEPTLDTAIRSLSLLALEILAPPTSDDGD